MGHRGCLGQRAKWLLDQVLSLYLLSLATMFQPWPQSFFDLKWVVLVARLKSENPVSCFWNDRLESLKNTDKQPILLCKYGSKTSCVAHNSAEQQQRMSILLWWRECAVNGWAKQETRKRRRKLQVVTDVRFNPKCFMRSKWLLYVNRPKRCWM